MSEFIAQQAQLLMSGEARIRIENRLQAQIYGNKGSN